MIERQAVNQDEIIIIAFMIMNDEVCSFCYTKYKTKELKTKHFSLFFRSLFRNIIHHYGRFDRAPRYSIQHIFDTQHFGGQDDRDITEEYLNRIGEEYERIQEEAAFDAAYVIKEIIPSFVRKAEGEYVVEQIEQAISNNKTDKIEDIVQNYCQFSEDILDENMGACIPFAPDTIKRYFSISEEDRVLFWPPGPLRAIIGPIVKKKMYAFTGIEKGGKTTTMNNLVHYAAKFHKKNTLWINCEMPEEDMIEMLWLREATVASDKDHSGLVKYPVFDCLNNQLDRCEIRKRSLNGGRLYQHGEIAEFRKNKNWKICTKCRGEKRFTKETKRFIPAIWFDRIRLHVINEHIIKRAVERSRVRRKVRIKTFPRLGASLTDVEQFIRQYLKKSKFRMDILVIDYPDVLMPEEGKMLTRENVDYIWKKIAGLSSELECAIFVADQAVKTARNRRSIGKMDTSESKTKDGHLDLRLGINVTDDELELGLARMNTIFRRKGKTPNSQVMCLQRRETADMFLDMEFWPNSEVSYSVKK